MRHSPHKDSCQKRHLLLHHSRREFLKLSALGALAAAASPAAAGDFIKLGSGLRMGGRGNTLPGRIVILRDPEMGGHLSSVDRDRVEEDVLLGVRTLTGMGDTGAAFESLFPGLHSGSTIAIKVNCLAVNDTRWEVVRGVVSGLSQMLGGTYNVSQVTIFDSQTDLYYGHGYDESEFNFEGNYPLISSSANCSSTYYIYGGHRLSNYILDSDYVINIPVLKAHNVGYQSHQITTAFKNHYGAICPHNLCNNITGMLTVNTDTNIRDKTCLVVVSGIWGTYDGDPWEPPQMWNTYPEQTPNTLLITTDPVTEAYWARDIINEERVTRVMPVFPCTWIEQASGAPYYLGVSDPGEMTVLGVSAGAEEVPIAETREAFLACNSPNPFARSTTLRFWLKEGGPADITVVTVSGRVVRRLGGRVFPEGYSQLRWDGRDSQGRVLGAGVYFARLETGSEVHTRRVVLVR